MPDDCFRWAGLGIDVRVLAFTFAASLVCQPALWRIAGFADAAGGFAVRDGGGQSLGGAGSGRLRQVLIAGEVALTVVLLAGAGLLIRTLVYLETQPPGFDATNVITAKVSLDDARYHDAAAFHNLWSAAWRRCGRFRAWKMQRWD